MRLVKRSASSQTDSAVRLHDVKRFLGVLAFLTIATLSAAGGEKRISVPDVVLTDQNGRSVRFDELVRGKIAVVNFIFTSCTTVCSPMGASFAALQQKLGTRGDVALISVTIDPGTDTPARLKSWSERFHARPGWTLLTGPPEDIERLLKTFGVYTANRFAHTPVALVGSEVSGRWERVSGLLTADKFVTVIDGFRPRAATGEASTK